MEIEEVSLDEFERRMEAAYFETQEKRVRLGQLKAEGKLNYEISTEFDPTEREYSCAVVLTFKDGSEDAVKASAASFVDAELIALRQTFVIIEDAPPSSFGMEEVQAVSDAEASARDQSSYSGSFKILEDLVNKETLSKTTTGLLTALQNRKIWVATKKVTESDGVWTANVSITFRGAKYSQTKTGSSPSHCLDAAVAGCVENFIDTLRPLLLGGDYKALVQGYPSKRSQDGPKGTNGPVSTELTVKSIADHVEQHIEGKIEGFRKKWSLVDRSITLDEFSTFLFTRFVKQTWPDAGKQWKSWLTQTPDFIIVYPSSILIVEVAWVTDQIWGMKKYGKYAGFAMAVESLGYSAQVHVMAADAWGRNCQELHEDLLKKKKMEMDFVLGSKVTRPSEPAPDGWWNMNMLEHKVKAGAISDALLKADLHGRFKSWMKANEPSMGWLEVVKANRKLSRGQAIPSDVKSIILNISPSM